MAFRASEFAKEGERERKLYAYKDGEKKGERQREIKVVLGISEEYAPVTSKAERLLKDGSSRLTL